MKNIIEYPQQKGQVGSWLAEAIKVIRWRKKNKLYNIHSLRSDFPRRIEFVKSGLPHSWPASTKRTCDICKKRFNMWVAMQWDELSKALQRCIICVPCFRKIITSNTAIRVPVGAIKFKIKPGTSCSRLLLIKYRKMLS